MWILLRTRLEVRHSPARVGGREVRSDTPQEIPRYLPHLRRYGAGRMTPHSVTPLDAARALQAQLVELGITADVNDGYGLAVVSVGVDLVVWCSLENYRWRNGTMETWVGPRYASHPITDPLRAAVRVSRRYCQLREVDGGVVIQGRPSWLPL